MRKILMCKEINLSYHNNCHHSLLQNDGWDYLCFVYEWLWWIYLTICLEYFCRYAALPRPLIDIESDDPFHVGDHIKSYVYNNSTTKSSIRGGNYQSHIHPDVRPKHSDITQLSDLLYESRISRQHSETSSTTWDTTVTSQHRTAAGTPTYDHVPVEPQYSTTAVRGGGVAPSANRSSNNSTPSHGSSRSSSDNTPPPLPPRDYREPVDSSSGVCYDV